MKAMNIQNLFLAAICALFAVGCYENNNRNTSIADEIEMLTGDDGNKVWKIRREISNVGQRDEMTRDEKNDQIHFYVNNRFTILDVDRQSAGTWLYDGQTLIMEYDGEVSKGPTETYTVIELTKNRMRLRSADGSELVLVDQDFR